MINDLIINDDGVYISSRVIANKLAKEHKHILRDIREKIGSPNLGSEIKTGSYINRGKNEVEYLLSFQKCILLLMCYTGLTEEKENIIKMFTKYNSTPRIATRKELALAVLEAEKELEQANLIIEQQKPAVEFYNTVTQSNDWISIAQVAKEIAIKGLGEITLFQFLRNEKVLMSNNDPYQKYVDLGYFKIVQNHYTVYGVTKISKKTVASQKGLAYIIKITQNFNKNA